MVLVFAELLHAMYLVSHRKMNGQMYRERRKKLS